VPDKFARWAALIAGCVMLAEGLAIGAYILFRDRGTIDLVMAGITVSGGCALLWYGSKSKPHDASDLVDRITRRRGRSSE
jgi:hypothetical protein